VRAAITLSLIFALLAISGAALYSAHGDFDKTKEMLDKLLSALTGRIGSALGFLLRLEVLQRLDRGPTPLSTPAVAAGFAISEPVDSNQASKKSMDQLQLFCQAMNVKVDRIGRYLSVMETERPIASRKPHVAPHGPSGHRTRSIVQSRWSFTTWRATTSSRSRQTASPCGVRRIRKTASSFRIPMQFHRISSVTS
jgi:hypothetical protein